MPMFSKVLVVDDSPVDRRLVSSLLKRDPFIEAEFAENGAEALEKIENQVPKLILTDLVMPEMDGLSFVRAVARRNSMVPIILMTAHGSGAVAAEALRCGATSYIPKSQLVERLVGSVQRILGMVRGDYNPERLVDYQTKAAFSFRLDNKTSLVDAVLGLIQETASTAHFGTAHSRLQMIVALEQALLNALYHGNLELTQEQLRHAFRHDDSSDAMNIISIRKSTSPYCDRGIFVDIELSKADCQVRVRDEGPGFDTNAVFSPADHAAFETDSGQGLTLMRTFMDQVSFNDEGNEVLMVKRAEHPSDSPNLTMAGAY